MDAILQILLITALLSIVINTILKRYDFPPIIGYIIAGAFISYLFSLRETSLQTLYDVSEFGIAFLMFTIGLGFSINNFKELRKEVFVLGTLQVVLSSLFFAAIAFYLFALPLTTAIIIGCALALSSTAIVLKILNETRELKQEYGRIVLGILLFQDLAVIPIILMISFFTTELALETMLANTLLSALLLLTILFFAGKYLITPFLTFVFDADSHELFIGSVLLIAVAASYTAYHFGFSYSLGAFIGGMLLAETPFKYQVDADLIPFRDLLLGVFFVTVGMQISVEFLASHVLLILAIMAAVMVLKTAIIFTMLMVFTTASSALKSAIALSQVGEFSFVVLELSRIGGITTKEINQPLIIAVVFSMILTPFIVKNLQVIVKRFVRTASHRQEPFSSAGASGHIVVLGYGSLGRQVCKTLRSQGLLYIAVDSKLAYVEKSRKNGDPFILGNAHQQQILFDADVQNAMAVIITLEKDEETALLVESVFHLAPGVSIVVSGRNDDSTLLRDRRIRSFVHEHRDAARSMVTQAVTCSINQNITLG
ncbi:cation:proton antiporter [bacterium]|jgi:CPA2 family monovalent cation:H+ antiporter-2|nr:cation:proton antiporter [bacterium]